MARPKPVARRPAAKPLASAPPPDPARAAEFIGGEGASGAVEAGNVSPPKEPATAPVSAPAEKPTSKKTERTTVRLPVALLRRLGHHCVDARTTQTAVMLAALEAYLSAKGA